MQTNGQTATYRITGMNCQGCVRQATEAIRALPEVESVVVSLEEATAKVRWKPALPVDDKRVIQAIAKAGFSAVPLGHSSLVIGRSPWSPLEGWRFNVMFGSVALALLMLGEWAFGLGMEHWFHWAAFALALPVQLICGARFYRGAWMQLKRGQSNMDTLVALGSTTAFVFSAWGLFSGWHGHLYFMEAVGIITLISVGHWLESLASARAADALRTLLNLAPQTARRLDSGTGVPPVGAKTDIAEDRQAACPAAESEVPVSELRAGDRVSLRPGDRVPVDGEVVEGASAVDESMLTGESLPVDKVPGAKLYAGTVNADGRLVMHVTATGEATALAQIIAVVQRAQSSRANIQKLGDQVSSVFVPVVVVIAIGTALWWGLAFDTASGVAQSLAHYLWPAMIPQSALAAAFIQAAAVLIVACPCAMGLATPAAIMAGTNAAARRGILIRDGGALEKSGDITAVVFDKTGTLTEGKLTLADFKAGEMVNEVEAKQLAVALAEPSNHPLSRAVVTLGNDQRPPFQDWHELRGLGVEAVLEGATVRLGSLKWLAECGVNLSATSTLVSDWTGRGATVLGLARDGQLLALLALQDTLKRDAAVVTGQLLAAGHKTFLLTGDHRATAEAIAAQGGIAKENVFAEVRPEQKAEIVKMLQARGERVAFVGDGINDAPALEQADLGIAVTKASDVAREAADIILLKSDIHAIPEALGLAKATLRTIKQNLFWAFFYNAAAVPLAALGFINPLLCAAAMGLSDLVVIGNALRLRRWKP